MLLVQRRSPDLRAYFVWAPLLKMDNEEAARSSTQRFLAPNSAYFWTPELTLPQTAGSVLGLDGEHIAWDVYLLYEKGKQWGSSFPKPAYWQQQLGIAQGDPLDIPALDRRIQSLRGAPR